MVLLDGGLEPRAMAVPGSMAGAAPGAAGMAAAGIGPFWMA